MLIEFIALYCLASCKRNYRDKKGKIAATGCRFLFPRPESKVTQLHSGRASVKREARTYSKNYVLARKKSEQNINDYNPLLLMALRANMDIQFISSSDKVLEAYVVGYTAKGEFANAAQELRSKSNHIALSCLRDLLMPVSLQHSWEASTSRTPI